MKKYSIICLMAICSITVGLAAAGPNYDLSKLKREKLGRGVIAVRQSSGEVFVTWRYLSSDAMDTAFNVYRDGKQINDKPVKDVTFFIDKNKSGGVYSVKPVGVDEHSISWTLPENAPVGYVHIPLEKPADGVTPTGNSYTYAASKASIGDVDGDGEYEIILKWDPSNARDNSLDGYTGNVYIDCYKLTGEKLWRIDLGRNIRAGNHYTQLIVYDLDGDGIAEIVLKTADGTVDGKGKVIGDAKADYREAGDPNRVKKVKGMDEHLPALQGRILTGPEFLTIFSGKTGEALDTVDYYPPRGDIKSWGDGYGNRSDRFLAAVGYLDGVHPSVIMCRGYYTRSVLAAYDWDGKKLKQRWVFDSNTPSNEGYAGQGNHNLRVGDVDGDGCDEIIYGQCAIDHDGTGLYTTGLGHGDRIHMTQFMADDPQLQVWVCHEHAGNGVTLREAATGKIIFQHKNNKDTEPAIAADMDPTSPGVEMWANGMGIYNTKGELLANPEKIVLNMTLWWDGDLLREMLDPASISKYNWKTKTFDKIMKFDWYKAPHRLKAAPVFLGDMYGDWREEILLRENDSNAMRLYVSTIPTEYRFHTFLEDPVYRIGLACFPIAYSQPSQPGFYFGPDLLGKGIFRGTLLKNKE